MSFDGLTQGVSGPERQLGQDPVIVPVQAGETAVETAQPPELTKSPETSIPSGPIPGGARPLEVDEDATDTVTRDIAEASEAPNTVTSKPEAAQGVVGETGVEDPNAEAHDAITDIGTPGGESTLESIISNPIDQSVAPSNAPEISAFPERGLGVPSTPTATPGAVAPTMSEVARGFADPYPLPGSKSAKSVSEAPQKATIGEANSTATTGEVARRIVLDGVAEREAQEAKDSEAIKVIANALKEAGEALARLQTGRDSGTEVNPEARSGEAN